MRGGDVPVGDGPVVYWMSRDQRAMDNWALCHALAVAREHRRPLHVVFALVPEFANAGARQYCFMLRGLRELESTLGNLGIPFHLATGPDPGVTVPSIAEKLGCSMLVTDFSPLRIGRAWRDSVSTLLCPVDVPVKEVDAHNVVPTWEASDKQEYAARTIRKKINGRLEDFLTDFPTLEDVREAVREAAEDAETSHAPNAIDWDGLIASASDVGSAVPEVISLKPPRLRTPGEAAARTALVGDVTSFLPTRLALYGSRNDPNVPTALSGLSPYLHFGQLSAQRCALEASKHREEHPDAVDSYLEELIVRRELADNYCLHNPNYDSVLGAPGWAQESLALHASDTREYEYTLSEMENSQTHDELWNAAQSELKHLGTMHGFMRMYWAKKILEWTGEGPDAALANAIYLNDRYQLDGRDPNGYVGCMWAICGVHDQGWKERDVFGKVRYMNYAGCKRKFKIAEYVARVEAEVAKERAVHEARAARREVVA